MRLATWMFGVIILTTLFMMYDSMAKDEIIIKDDKIVVCKPPVNGVVVCY